MNDLELFLEQKQVLSPKALQNLEILQMNAQELDAYLSEKALENPVIDVDAPREMLPTVSYGAAEPYRSRASRREDDDPPDDGDPLERLAAAPTDPLADHLLLQLIPHTHSSRDRAVLHYLVHSLDDNGYLTVTSRDLCGVFGLTAEEAQRYISILQGLEPAGIGAGSLAECLILQLKRTEHPDAELACLILSQHIELIAENKLKKLSAFYNTDVARISGVLQLIRSLNPRPANGFSSGEAVCYVTPDVTVTRDQEGFQITINGTFANGLQISDAYRDLLRSPDQEVRTYLQQKYQEARWLRTCLEQRNTTLLRISRQLVTAQTDFFLRGSRFLKPLFQAELSRQLALSDSTVSRAIRGKYLACGWGVFPLKYFFSKAAKGGGADMTVHSLKERISAIIAQEDKRRPLSDQKIADMLQAEGVRIMRRTVAKYRSELSILDTSKRRAF